VRGFTQDDGHIFCTEDQIEAEVTAFHQQAMQVYADFGFSDVQIKIALRPDPRLGDDATWDKAENALRSALRPAGVEWQELPGEGAFYGPKIEYHLRDAIGRTWQLGTMQVDFMMPGRLGAEYVDEHSQRRHPVMLHRAIVGSMERFIGILIEHHAGHFPAWLAPVQAVVMNITGRPGRLGGERFGNPLQIKASGCSPICGTRRSAIRSRAHAAARAVPAGGRRPRKGKRHGRGAYAGRGRSRHHVRSRFRLAFRSESAQ
jgi:threonyl-tRNA synthetase